MTEIPPPSLGNPFDSPANLSVTITDLPEGASMLQISEFCKKVGVLATHPETGEDLILLNSKQHRATVTYYYPEGANHAISLLNGEVFSFDSKGNQYRVKVARASHEPIDFSIWKGAMRQQRKVFSYLGDHSEELKKKEEKMMKIMIIKNAFKPSEMIQQPELYSQIIKDWTEICNNYGKVTLVKPMEHNQDGVVIVRFDTIQAAATATGELDDAQYRGRTISTDPWDGSDLTGGRETFQDEEERIANFERYLDGEDVETDQNQEKEKENNNSNENHEKEIEKGNNDENVDLKKPNQ